MKNCPGNQKTRKKDFAHQIVSRFIDPIPWILLSSNHYCRPHMYVVAPSRRQPKHRQKLVHENSCLFGNTARVQQDCRNCPSTCVCWWRGGMGQSPGYWWWHNGCFIVGTIIPGRLEKCELCSSKLCSHFSLTKFQLLAFAVPIARWRKCPVGKYRTTFRPRNILRSAPAHFRHQNASCSTTRHLKSWDPHPWRYSHLQHWRAQRPGHALLQDTWEDRGCWYYDGPMSRRSHPRSWVMGYYRQKR